MNTEGANNISVKKIGATLKHGRFVAYNIYLGCFGIVFSFVLIASKPLFMHDDMRKRVLGYMIVFSIWALFFFGSLYTIIRTVKIRKEVLKWLEDAVELDAYAERFIRLNYNGLKVHFVYKNEKLDRHSRCKHWRSPKGFSLWWQYYINNSFKIYYSPRYDEVMLFIAKVPTKQNT